MLRLRVSDLDQWVGFVQPKMEEFEVTLDEFLAIMRREGPETPQMRAGTAFHSVLEHAQVGEELMVANEGGFSFTFADDLDPVRLCVDREESVEREVMTPVGVVLLRGKVDGKDGIEVTDYKLTFGSFDAERYADSLQWRAYLAMTGCRRFRYLVFTAKLDEKDGSVWIHDVHELVFWAYPEMEEEVVRRVGELAEFVAVHLPGEAKLQVAGV